MENLLIVIIAIVAISAIWKFFKGIMKGVATVIVAVLILKYFGVM